MSNYKGLFTFDVNNHKYVPVEQADGIISFMNYHPEEPKEYWCIDWTGGINKIIPLDDSHDKYVQSKKEIGNYFETEEEAKKAVEKLKARQRLIKKGFRFIDWDLDDETVADGKIWFDLGGIEESVDQALTHKDIKDAMDLLFGSGGQ